MTASRATPQELLCALCFLLAILNLAWTLRGSSGRPSWFKHGPAMAALLDEEAARREGGPADPTDIAVAYWRDTLRNPPPAVGNGSLLFAALLTIATAAPLVLPMFARRARHSPAEPPS